MSAMGGYKFIVSSPHSILPSCAETRNEEFMALHWGTLLEGAELAWQNDVDKQNRCVQSSVAAGVPNSKARPALRRCSQHDAVRSFFATP